MALIPEKNRGYTFAFVALAAVLILAVILTLKSPAQSQFVWKQFVEFVLYLTGIVILGKEAGKSLQGFANGLFTKNGGNKPDKE